MSDTTLRRFLFLGLWLSLPWPMPIFQEAFVPAARYALLTGAALTVGLKEGVEGTGPLLIALFAGWALATTLVTWGIAWLGARILNVFEPRWRVACLLGLLLIGLSAGLFFEPYSTPFGRAERGGLLEILS